MNSALGLQKLAVSLIPGLALCLALGGCSNDPSGPRGGSGRPAEFGFAVFFDTDDSPVAPANTGDRNIQFEQADGADSGAVTGSMTATQESYPSAHGVRGEVVFSRTDPANPGLTEIWKTDLTGANAKQLTSLGGENLMPVWDRSGNFIAFSHDGDIWMMDADGTDQRQLTSGSDLDYDPAWAPDGTEIMFSRHAGEADIYKVSTAPGMQPAMPFITGAGSQDHPSWHLNGVLFEDDSDGDDEIWWRRNDGTREKLTDNLVEDDDPVWSPNGVFAVYASADRIQFVRLDPLGGSAPSPLRRTGRNLANPACHANY